MNRQLLNFCFLVLLFSCQSQERMKSSESALDNDEISTEVASLFDSLLGHETKELNQNSDNHAEKPDLKKLFMNSDDWIYKVLSSVYNDSIEIQKALEEYLTVQDIDYDNEDELIYHGSSGSEALITCIYELESNKLKGTFCGYQHIKSTTKVNDSITEIVMGNPGCCMAVEGSLEKYYYIQTRDTIYDILKRKIGTVSYMKEGQYVIEPIKFRTVHESYNLRAIPSPKSHVGEHSNVLAKLPSGTVGEAYFEEIDSTGRVWWFVEISPQTVLDMEVYGEPEDTITYYSGWISSRYTEKFK